MRPRLAALLGPLVVFVLALSGVARGGVAVQPAAPDATTVKHGKVTQRSTLLKGVVNPNGSETTYFFEYGRTTAYGNTNQSSSAGAGSAPMDVSFELAKLKPVTVYKYRLVAANAFGTTYGAGKEFRTRMRMPSGCVRNRHLRIDLPHPGGIKFVIVNAYINGKQRLQIVGDVKHFGLGHLRTKPFRLTVVATPRGHDLKIKGSARYVPCP